MGRARDGGRVGERNSRIGLDPCKKEMKIGKVENIKNSNAYSLYDNHNTYTNMLPKSICDDSQ